MVKTASNVSFCTLQALKVVQESNEQWKAFMQSQYLPREKTSVEVSRKDAVNGSFNVASSESESLQILFAVGESHGLQLLYLRRELQPNKDDAIAR